MAENYGLAKLEIGKLGPGHYLIEGYQVLRIGKHWRITEDGVNARWVSTLREAKEWIADEG